MDHTRVNTTTSSLSTAKWTSKQTLQGLKQSKGNHVSIFSSAQIVRAIIRQIPTYIHSGSIGSTGSGKKEISRNLWQQEQINSLGYEQWTSMIIKNIKVFFPECLEEQSAY